MEDKKYEQEENPTPEQELAFNLHLHDEIMEQIEAERLFEEAIRNGDILPPDVEEIPITEEELFRQIQEDERNERYDTYIN